MWSIFKWCICPFFSNKNKRLKRVCFGKIESVMLHIPIQCGYKKSMHLGYLLLMVMLMVMWRAIYVWHKCISLSGLLQQMSTLCVVSSGIKFKSSIHTVKVHDFADAKTSVVGLSQVRLSRLRHPQRHVVHIWNDLEICLKCRYVTPNAPSTYLEWLGNILNMLICCWCITMGKAEEPSKRL